MDAKYKPHGETLLHRLAQQGGATLPVHVTMAKELIAAGVNVNCKDILGWTPIIDIAIHGHKNAVDLARVLIASGADLAVTDHHGSDWRSKWQHGEEIYRTLAAAHPIAHDEEVLRRFANKSSNNNERPPFSSP